MESRSPGRQDSARARDLARGAEVRTADGKPLGRVGTAKGGYFQVEGHEPDFWLSVAYVASAEEDRVSLSLPADEVGEHRLHKPGLEAAGAGTHDRALTEEHALHTRERMEQELVEQRGTIDTDVRGTT